MRFRFHGSMLAALVLLTLACGERDVPATPTSAAAPAAPAIASTLAAGDEARQIFATRCVTCHGSEGACDGPGSAALSPKPRNFQDAAWQASVTDEHLEKVVMYGGTAVGKSPSMPGNPDLMAKPEIVRALVAHLRALARRT